MDWNQVFFVIFPYIALTLFLAVTIYRSIYRPFTVSSLSSQLLERKQLYWGTIPFHYGIVLILLLHLLALVFQELLDFSRQLGSGYGIAVGHHTLVPGVTTPEMRPYIDREEDQYGDQGECE